MEKDIELMQEKDIERKLKKEVEKRNGVCWKFLSSIAGVPDRLCLFEGGIIVFVELKRHGAHPRPLQNRIIGKIRELGFRVEVIDSEEGIRELMTSLEEGKKRKKDETK